MQATVVAGGVSIGLTGEPKHFAELIRELRGCNGEEKSGLGLRQSEPQGLQEVWRAQAAGRATVGNGGGEGLDLCRVCQVELWQVQHLPGVRARGAEGAAVAEGADGASAAASSVDVTAEDGTSAKGR